MPKHPVFLKLVVSGLVVLTKKKNTCDQANEEKNYYLPACGEGAFLHLVKCHPTKYERHDSASAKYHTDNDEYLNSLFHNILLINILRFSLRQL